MWFCPREEGVVWFGGAVRSRSFSWTVFSSPQLSDLRSQRLHGTGKMTVLIFLKQRVKQARLSLSWEDVGASSIPLLQSLGGCISDHTKDPGSPSKGSAVSHDGVAIATGALLHGEVHQQTWRLPWRGGLSAGRTCSLGGWCPVCSTSPSIRGKENVISS